MSAFVDTNMLVYAADEVTPQPRKTRIAREILLGRNLHLSVQVLSGFIASARHPKKLDFSSRQEAAWLKQFLRFPVAPLTERTFTGALEIHSRFGLSHWDSMILASARELRCATLYSEDLSDGQDYDGVTVVNPFR